jgi:predicted transcriptional regulator
MDEATKIVVGGSLKDDLAAFRSAWVNAENGQTAPAETVIAFESREGLASLMTKERFKLLRYLHAHPEPSISALARGLGRHLRRVQADVHALEGAGLIDRQLGYLRTTADRISADIRL